MKKLHIFCTTALILMLSWGAQATANTANTANTAKDKPKLPSSAKTLSSNSTYSKIEWTDLMPADDLEALLNPPDYIDDIPEGSEMDQIDKPLSSANDPKAARYEQALQSKRVIKEFDGRKIEIPGFVVPLDFNEEMVITKFFLVPFFGACIHVPPPPPNQMIYIEYSKGLKLDNLYDPYTIEGTLHIESFDGGDMGTSAYSMEVKSISTYSE